MRQECQERKGHDFIQGGQRGPQRQTDAGQTPAEDVLNTAIKHNSGQHGQGGAGRPKDWS